jgi:beta-galactosidase
MERTSFNDGWQVRQKPDMAAELMGGAAPWMPVRLPHDALIAMPRDPDGSPAGGYFPGGVWQYQKSFLVPEEQRGRRIMVEFEGVYRSAAVYVNGVLAGHRPYGYSNFSVRLDPLVHYGQDNTVTVEATVHDDSRWYSGAGIYRNTKLVVGHPVHIALDGVRISTRNVDERAALVVVETTVENDTTLPASSVVVTELVDDGGLVVARDEAPLTAPAGQAQTLRQRVLVLHPKCWGLDSPTLYTCRSVLLVEDAEIDRTEERFGVRTLQLDTARGLRINGETVKLRGACLHHDNGVIGAATVERAEERRVELLKAAGFNALRSAHHPMSKAMLDACDRLGMAVMDEAFDMWTESKSHDDYARWFPEWWQQDVEAMVAKDFNHPSVVLYSIGNEIPEAGSPAGAVWGRSLAGAIRAVDDTRFVTNCLQPFLACKDEILAGFMPRASESGRSEGGREGGREGEDENAPAADDMGVNTMMTAFDEILPRLLQQEVIGTKLAESASVLDVVGYNYTDSRYEIDHELFPNRVMVGSETNPPKIDELWRLVRTHDYVIGDFTWTGWDYLGEAGIGRIEYEPQPEAAPFLGPYPWLTARTGDIDITGFRRPISYYREIVFGLRRDPFIAVEPPQHFGREPTARSPWSTAGVASWTWPGREGSPLRVVVYADADEVALLVNGSEVGRAPAGEKHRYRAEFTTTYEPGEVEAVAYRGVEELARTELRTATEPVRLDVGSDREVLRADDTDVAFLSVELVDGAGTLHPAADRAVTLAIDGPGELLGFGSADPCPEQTFAGTTHATYQGRALAVVRPTGPGRITVSVTAEGCEPRTVVLDAEPPAKL